MGANSQLFEFIINAAIDPVESQQWKNNTMYLKNVDKYNELSVSCLITPSNAKFMLLHENRPEDQIKGFFNEVYDLFVRVVMNPFYESTSRIDVP
jgi:trafficking protein particle complex subunit 2